MILLASGECLTSDETNKDPIHAGNVKQTYQSDVEDTPEDGEVTTNLDDQRPSLEADVEEERTRSTKDQDRQIMLLEDELNAVRREFENEKQQRTKLDLQIQSQHRQKQSRMIQTESQNDPQSVVTDVPPKPDIQQLGGMQRMDKQDPRRKEEATKWNELQSDMKKVQDILSEVRGQMAKMNIEMQLMPGRSLSDFQHLIALSKHYRRRGEGYRSDPKG